MFIIAQDRNAEPSVQQRVALFFRFLLRCFFAALLTSHASAGEWREASTDHFIIYADASETWLRTFAERLEKFDSGLRIILGLKSSAQDRSNRVVIYVLRDEGSVSRLCGKNCYNAAGFYLAKVGESIAFVPERSETMKPEVVLFHEYTHHLLLSNSRFAYPKWVSEGLAEFNSNAEPLSDGSLCFGQAAQHRAYALLRGIRTPLEVILDPGTRKFNGRESDSFYGRSWLLIHYLKFEESRKGQLAAYLEAFNKGESSLNAAKAAFGDLDALEESLDSYVNRNKLTCRQIPAKYLSLGTIDIRSLSPGEAATMSVKMRSNRGVNKQQAQDLVPESRRAAAAFPSDPVAQTTLAKIEYDAGNLDEAEIAVDRALAANPAARDALLFKGMIAAQRLKKSGSKDESAWAGARSWFIKANRLDTDAAKPLFLFFLAFIEQGIPPTENAGAALERAFELSPQDQQLKWFYAQHLLSSDRTAEARTVLLPLAYDPHQSGENKALKMVQAIDAGATGRNVLAAAINQTADATQLSDDNE